MLDELKKAFQFINSNNLARNKRNLALAAFILFVLLILANYYLFQQFVSDDLHIRFQQARLFFLNGQSPYDDNVQSYLANAAIEANWKISELALDYELAPQHLIVFLPFSLIENFSIGASLYLALIEFSMIGSTYMLSLSLAKNFQAYESIIFVFFGSISLFFILPTFAASNAAISMLLIVLTIISLQNQKDLAAGIFLGLFLFDIAVFPVVLIIIFSGLVKNKRNAPILWSIITLSLASLFFVIFDSNWPVGWLKNLFLSAQRVPFLTYPQALSMRYGIQMYQFLSIISLLLILWFVTEIWRNPFKSISAWVWILGLGGIINYYLIIQTSDESAIAFLFAVSSIISTWSERINPKRRVFVFIIAGLTLILPSILFYTLPNLQSQQTIQMIYLITTLILVLNLYWLRRWAVNPFRYEENSLLDW